VCECVCVCVCVCVRVIVHARVLCTYGVKRTLEPLQSVIIVAETIRE
jgi:hypothetical protein